MEPIRKTVSSKPGERKDRLIITVNRYAFVALLGLPIIAGLEMYYQNRYGPPNTIYIGGFWTFVYGASLLIAFLKRRGGPKKFIARLKARGLNVEESITLSDEGFEAAIGGYFTSFIQWTSLSSFKETKRYFIFILASTEFIIPKKHFTTDELNEIRAFLNQKWQSSNNPPMPVDINSTTSPPLP